MTPTLLHHREWLIQPETLRAMAATAQAFRGGPIPDARPASPLLSVEDGIGTVAIEGPILRKPDLFARVLFGATDSGAIGAALREAADRPDIKAVFLDIDSPGGTVAATPELAAAVFALNDKKPVYAFSSGLMCSAAYWVVQYQHSLPRRNGVRAQWSSAGAGHSDLPERLNALREQWENGRR